MGKHVDQTTQENLLTDIKNGMKVAEASAKHGVHVKTAYALVRRQADNTGTSALEIAKLRRENAELKEIIGLLTLEKKRGEKNRGGS
jgi:phosphotransferase system HPr-like phosphotransfer protein